MVSHFHSHFIHSLLSASLDTSIKCKNKSFAFYFIFYMLPNSHFRILYPVHPAYILQCTKVRSPTDGIKRLCIRVAPNLTFSNLARAEFGQISELKFGWSRSRIWLKFVFWSENNTPVIKLMASTMLSAAIEAV